MNPWLAVAPLGVLAFVIALEIRRPQPSGAIDALRVSAVVFVLAFVVAPLQVLLTDLTWVRGGSWEWVLNHLPTSEGFLLAEALALMGWLSITVAYGWMQKRAARGPALDAWFVSPALTLRVAVALTLVGTIALVIYTQSIGGWRVLIFDALAFRSSEPPVITRFAFLKSVAPLTLGGAYLAFGVRHDASQAVYRRQANAVFIASLLVSIVVLFHQAGRLSMLAFLACFPLAAMRRRGRVNLRAVSLMGGLFVVLVLFGKQLFNPAGGVSVLGQQWQSVQEQGSNALQLVGVEFSFPFLNLTHAIDDLSFASLRWFVDVPLGVLYLVPQRLLGVVHPPTLTAINSEELGARGAIPVDLVTYGWRSAWLLGVMIVSGGLGLALGWVDAYRRTTSYAAITLRTALVLFLAFRVMYADPPLVLQAGFPLLVTIVALLMAKRWTTLVRRPVVA